MTEAFRIGKAVRGRESMVKREIQALLYGIDVARGLAEALVGQQSRPTLFFVFNTDSKMIVDVLNNSAKPRTPPLRRLLQHVKLEISSLGEAFNGAVVSYIPRNQNLAHPVAKRAADVWRRRWSDR